jgi:hypothetical protein
MEIETNELRDINNAEIVGVQIGQLGHKLWKK